MRQAPTNRNVSPWMWEMAEREHAQYLKHHATLRGLGLTEEQADQYLDLRKLVGANIDCLGPGFEDFHVDDLGPRFQATIDALLTMRALLGYGPEDPVESHLKPG